MGLNPSCSHVFAYDCSLCWVQDILVSAALAECSYKPVDHPLEEAVRLTREILAVCCPLRLARHTHLHVLLRRVAGAKTLAFAPAGSCTTTAHHAAVSAVLPAARPAPLLLGGER
jgi:hypothetical protein